MRISRRPPCNFETPPKYEYPESQISLVPTADRGYIGIQRLGTVLDATAAR